MRLIQRDALWTVCAGLAHGAPLAFWAKRMAVSLIHGLTIKSPVPIVFGGAVMLVVALVAADIPARRA